MFNNTLTLIKYFKYFIKSDVNLALLEQGIVSGCNFLISIILAKALGITEFGVFSLTFMVVLFVFSMHSAIINEPMLTIIPILSENNKDKFTTYTLIAHALFTIVVIILLYLGLNMYNIYAITNSPAKYISLFLAIIGIVTHELYRKYFIVMLQFKLLFLVSILKQTQMIVCILVFFSQLTVEYILYVYAFSNITSIIFVYNKVKIKKIDLNETIRYSTRSLKISKWLTGAALMQWTSGNYFLIAGGLILGPIIVGAIRVMQTITGIINIFTQGLENILPVIYGKGYLKNKKNLITNVYNTWFKYGAIVFILLTILYLFRVEALTLFGSDYVIYENLVIYVLIATLIGFLSMPIRVALRTIEKTRVIFIVYIINTIISLLIATYLIEKYNEHGVVIGIVILTLTAFVPYFLTLSYHLKWYRNF